MLGGDDEVRVVSCEALTNVEALRFDRNMFNWFLDECVYPGGCPMGGYGV